MFALCVGMSYLFVLYQLLRRRWVRKRKEGDTSDEEKTEMSEVINRRETRGKTRQSGWCSMGEKNTRGSSVRKKRGLRDQNEVGEKSEMVLRTTQHHWTSI